MEFSYEIGGEEKPMRATNSKVKINEHESSVFIKTTCWTIWGIYAPCLKNDGKICERDTGVQLHAIMFRGEFLILQI